MFLLFKCYDSCSIPQITSHIFKLTFLYLSIYYNWYYNLFSDLSSSIPNLLMCWIIVYVLWFQFSIQFYFQYFFVGHQKVSKLILVFMILFFSIFYFLIELPWVSRWIPLFCSILHNRTLNVLKSLLIFLSDFLMSIFICGLPMLISVTCHSLEQLQRNHES